MGSKIKITQDPNKVRIPLDVCKSMTLAQIRSTPEYKKLTPFGSYINISGTYKFGCKSELRKAELCRVMDNPKAYWLKNLKNLKEHQNSCKRKRKTRKGMCLTKARKPDKQGKCSSKKYSHKGITTTGKPCCYRRKMSQKTINKRLKK